MPRIFDNGGLRGKPLDYKATDQYVIGTSNTGVETITFVSFNTSTTTSINMPAGLQENDIVIIASVGDNNTQNLPSTGWTNGQNGAGNTTQYRWAWKRMGASPDTSATGLASSSAHIAFAFRGVSTDVSPFDANSPSVATAGTGAPNPPAITTVSNNAVLVALGFLDDDNSASIVAAQSGFTLIGAAENNATVMASYRLKDVPSAEDPPPFGGALTDAWVAATLALRPNVTAEDILGNFKNSGVWSMDEAYNKRKYDTQPRISLRASNSSLTTTVAIPGTVQEGDILFLIDRTTNSSTPSTTVIPTGFTELSNESVTATTSRKSIISYRVANSTVAGTTLTGMTGSTINKILLCLSTNKTNPTINIGPSVETSGITDADPIGVNIDATGVQSPLAVLGFFGASGTVVPTITANNFAYATLTGGTNLLVSYSIYNDNPPLSTINFDMPDEGTGNLINALYFRVS